MAARNGLDGKDADSQSNKKQKNAPVLYRTGAFDATLCSRLGQPAAQTLDCRLYRVPEVAIGAVEVVDHGLRRRFGE